MALILFEDEYFTFGKHTVKSAKFTSLTNYHVYDILMSSSDVPTVVSRHHYLHKHLATLLLQTQKLSTRNPRHNLTHRCYTSLSFNSLCVNATCCGAHGVHTYNYDSGCKIIIIVILYTHCYREFNVSHNFV